MALNNNEILSFIEDYRRHRLLWDSTDKFYSNKLKRIDALKELGEKYSMDVAAVKKKIKSLRSYFSREHQKLLSKQSEDGIEGGYSSTWFAYNSLAFISDTITPNETRETEEVARTGTLDVYDEEDAATEEKTKAGVLNHDGWVQPEVVFEFKPTLPKKQNNLPTKRKIEMSENDLLLQKALRTFNEEEDQYDIFGKYVASEMRNLSSEYLRKKMKRKFQQVILGINEEDELLSNPASQNCSNPNSE